MKTILKNALIGALIGLVMVPIIFMEIYYFGGQNAYLSEVIHFKNLQNTIIILMIYGLTFGIILTLPTFIKKVKCIKSSEIKDVLQMIISVILVIIQLSIVSFLKLSEIIDTLITFNTVIFFVISAIVFIIYNSIQVKIINKKIKE